ncbi:MAG: ribosome maturation factor RimM [Oscillospiraceae bacterium]
MIKQYLEVGQIVGTHGVKGELRVNPWCDNVEFLNDFNVLYFDKEGNEKLTVTGSRPHGNVVLLTIDGIDTIEKGATLKNKILYIKREDAKLEKGTWFIEDLMGCNVIDVDTGKNYGKITDVSQTGANDVWAITNNENEEVLIPAIKSVVIETDVENEIIKIRPLKGLFSEKTEIRDE